MKSAGVIVEYNPFHNGHLYHLQQTKEVTRADVVVAVMSGYFLQRGEPALLSKWARTKMALSSGVDIVVELPYAFSTQKAELFANGAISILEAMNVDEVCFGSESGNISSFLATLSAMEENKAAFDVLVQKYSREGNSYPKAASLAYRALNIPDATVDLSRPNNILGYHYVKAIADQKARIKPITITRTGANYHDEHFQSPSIASATSIRKALFSNEGTLQDILNYVPEATYTSLFDYKKVMGQLHDWEQYFSLLKYKVLTTDLNVLASLYEIEEGLEHRIVSSIKEATSYHEFMENLKTKRYTWTRLQRACTHILTHTKKDVMKRVTADHKSSYIRLLGMSQNGRAYLQKYKKELPLPLLTKLTSQSNEMQQLDIRAATTYGMVLPEPIRSEWMKTEYSTPPIQYDEESKSFL
ncbi:nucleotidyltransferase [Bacillus suaedaesalsae]|uniref:tRNA(Met) cytidine acetate ligase n=1 Tax=Bacillus suaedaesalsae TaxID=2810349 RepID=A0ABS2DJI4_9BACI|nr:nucleotidyltransferase [Bacillus suaedaesalsae]MBM6618567.1 nucleotidyltransferase [Bacillus suaedaesalsae]